MITNKKNSKEQELLSNADIDELILELKNDLESNRQRFKDQRWLKYVYPALKREAKRIRSQISRSIVYEI
jgi:hypothetical protein